MHYSKAWSRGGPQIVKEEALKRLAEEGWDSLRPALSITVRCAAMSCKYIFCLTRAIQRMVDVWNDVQLLRQAPNSNRILHSCCRRP